MTRTFRTRAGAYEEMRRRFFSRVLPILLIAGGVVGGIQLWARPPRDGLWGLAFPVLLFGGIITFACLRVLGRYRRFFRSFRLEVSDRELTRHAEGAEPLTLHAYDISSIEEDKSGALVIRGREPRHTIVVPAQVEERAELLDRLNSLQPVTIGVVATAFEKGRALRGVLRLVGVVLVSTVQNDLLFVPAVALTLVLLAWDSYDVQRIGRPASRRAPRLAANAFFALLVLFLAWSHWYLR
ncbi:hypothetical protein [Flaviaesturariibacter aridisoli]|uniref:Uncharacterized protein n=1 Tax=Flaviaesturariibacter aridisoli TaxID=2545761 RepID=A0A4R4DY41_9BACT|nr:hypothetical protein [Flaviaesturariibacter aridisoli]TCZ70451.1 hypothetical protein E0486_10875 [Flaviaesturariibacter aridisoli]